MVSIAIMLWHECEYTFAKYRLFPFEINVSLFGNNILLTFITIKLISNSNILTCVGKKQFRLYVLVSVWQLTCQFTHTTSKIKIGKEIFTTNS